LGFNEKPGESSLKRCSRVCKLLDAKPAMSLEDMIKISDDKHDGSNNSIWRDGSLDSKTRTLMNMSIYVPLNGFPRVYVKMDNRWAREKSGELILNHDFWNQEGTIDIKK
jgi:hypothetical protein